MLPVSGLSFGPNVSECRLVSQLPDPLVVSSLAQRHIAVHLQGPGAGFGVRVWDLGFSA